jgi:PIN domain nuclease of toxin-antitoxin system
MTVVIDSSAVLAILKNERGGDQAVSLSRGALLSAVNLIEVRSKMMEAVSDVDRALSTLDRLEINVVPFTPHQGKMAADLWPIVKGKSVSLADRACIALAIDKNATLVTADRGWAKLGLSLDLSFIR